MAKNDAQKSYADIRTKLKPSLTSKEYLIASFLSETIQLVVEKIFQSRSNVSVLDAGCGLKPYKVFFGNKADTYVGIDVNQRSKADIISIGENVPLKEGSFDIILSMQVLEHVSEPMAMLKELHRVCNRSGFLVLSTHGIYLEEHGDNDLWRWTSKGLVKMVQSAGFNSVNVYSMSSYESIMQLLLYYVFLPDKFNILNMLGNMFARRVAKAFPNTGPKIHLIHLIVAKK